ncbi:hypothetical protein PGTUg99_013178 [Puccinia graminis f. sp. tritici]|uniref:Uncharacterized protein n=1 Tax=Puccinia graminis f. sp. tritici TaxID=56615 RepID=A0A5B0PFV5_PUCGR|nr:hypothetical protein PGTUg99_013178 [Puccinia graminis f. sp. tritici]
MQHDESFSSTSSECQSTIKASFLPLPTPDSQSSLNHHHQPPKNHSKRSVAQIDRTILAVLASGAKGTAPASNPVRNRALSRLDWIGMRTLFYPKVAFRPSSDLSVIRLRTSKSSPALLSDELEDLNLGSHPSSHRSVNEEEGDFGDDFSYHHPANQSTSLTSKRIIDTSPANQIAHHSAGNSASIDDNTPRIRTRPSLTPSLMSDRSSFTSFPELEPEPEDDLNKGFFDDIEFPPEFGIPNNLAPASTSSTPTPTPTTSTPKPTQSSNSDSTAAFLKICGDLYAKSERRYVNIIQSESKTSNAPNRTEKDEMPDDERPDSFVQVPSVKKT